MQYDTSYIAISTSIADTDIDIIIKLLTLFRYFCGFSFQLFLLKPWMECK